MKTNINVLPICRRTIIRRRRRRRRGFYIYTYIMLRWRFIQVLLAPSVYTSAFLKWGIVVISFVNLCFPPYFVWSSVSVARVLAFYRILL